MANVILTESRPTPDKNHEILLSIACILIQNITILLHKSVSVQLKMFPSLSYFHKQAHDPNKHFDILINTVIIKHHCWYFM